MKRTKRALKIMFASSLNQIILIVAGFVLPPLIISNYGSEINGLVNSVKQILCYFNILGVGLSAASQVALYRPLADKNEKQVNKIMSTTSDYLNKTGLAFIVFAGTVALILPLLRSDNLDYSTIFSIAAISAIGSIIEYIYLTKYKVLLLADQRQYVISNVYSQGTIINTIFAIALIYLNASIIWVQTVASLAYLIRMLLLIKTIKRDYPKLSLKEKPDYSLVPNLWQAFFYKASDMILNYIPITIITIVCGYALVSVYSVYNLIFLSLGMIVNIMAAGLAAIFGNIITTNNTEKLNEIFAVFEFGFRIVIFFIYTCAIILAIPFVSIYINNTDGINYILPSVAITFSIYGLFRNIRTPYLILIDAVGNYDENVAGNIAEVIIFIALSTAFVFQYGIAGVLFGGLVAALIRSVSFIFRVRKSILNTSSLKNILKLTVNFFVFALVYILKPDVQVNSYIQWFGASVQVAFISLVIFLLINIAMDYKVAKNLLGRLLNIKS